MKILQISSAQFLGGGERYLADLSQGLAARGHEVFAAVRPASPLIEQLKVLPASSKLTLPLRNSFDAVSAHSLSAFIRENRIEIVHAHMARDYPLAAYATSRNRDARLIVTRHVLFPLSRVHKLTLARVARAIAVSQAVALQLRSEKIIRPDRIAVIPNGIDVERFARARQNFVRSQILSGWNIPQDALLVGTLGELKGLKGQEEFLRAASIVAQHHPNTYFIIAGIDSSPDQKNRILLERVTDELGLHDRVRFLDWMDDVSMLHCALNVFVSASRAESFGLAIAEAMATGTAIVATMTEGAREILDDGKSGLLVPVGDAEAIAEAVIQILNDPAKRQSLITAAADAVRSRFSLERMIDETEKLYQESIAG